MGLKLSATITSPNITNKDVKSENNSQSLVAYYQNLFDEEDISYHYNPNDCQNTKRKSINFRPTAFVALTSFEKPVVTNIYDIAPDGVSFLHANKRAVTNSEFKMDILILDSLKESLLQTFCRPGTNNKCSVSQRAFTKKIV